MTAVQPIGICQNRLLLTRRNRQELDHKPVEGTMSNRANSAPGSARPTDNQAIFEAQSAFEHGNVGSAAEIATKELERTDNPTDFARLTLIKAMAEFEQGSAVGAIKQLRELAALAANLGEEFEFSATLALFARESQFLAPQEAVPTLSRVRQLAARLGNPVALARLHLGVARLEACRGHSVDARRHLEIARTAAAGIDRPMLHAAIELTDASLEKYAGNLRRATRSAKECFERSSRGGFGILRAGALANLGFLAVTQLELTRAEDYLQRAVEETSELSFVRLGALDNLLQVALHGDDLDRCHRLMKECSAIIAQHDVPTRSWYDLAHHANRCGILLHIGDWESVVEVTEEADAVMEMMQFRSVRVQMLCAAARALAHLGEAGRAQSKLTTAISICPRGAVEALIMLEGATGSCLTLRGDVGGGDAHYSRAMSAAGAIGNRLLEREIAGDRKTCQATVAKRSQRAIPTAELPIASHQDRSLVLADVATILGGSSSIDLVAHRAKSLVQGTSLEPKLRVTSLSDQEFRPETSVRSTPTASGGFEIQLRGSDRLVSLTFADVASLDEVTLVKSVVDVLHAAVRQRGRDPRSSIDQDLWPETTTLGDGDTIFRSPRMNEILRVAIRLAATDLPILITGETGTGKDVFARLVHSHSLVKTGPFVPFNCSAVPRDLIESQLFGHRRGAFTGAIDSHPGVIQSAAGGTLFLDEIGDLDLGLQPKLLRFIESGEIHTLGDPRPKTVKVRLIAATNADLEHRAASGTFRADLLFRLGTARIILPPLRERKDEIPALTTSFINKFSREANRPRLRVSDDLIAALLLYDWPGNIRQLSNELHRIVAMAEPGQTLTSADLSPAITEGWTVAPKSGPDAPNTMRVNLDQPLPQAIEELERNFVDRAMHASGGRVNEAAQLLGISRKGLFLKRRRWGYLDPESIDADE